MRSEEITRAYSRSRRPLRFVFQNRRSWSADERGCLITRMLPGAGGMALVFLRRLCADLASNMELRRVYRPHVLVSNSRIFDPLSRFFRMNFVVTLRPS